MAAHKEPIHPGRQSFLNAISLVAPEVLSDLQQNVLSFYVEWQGSTSKQTNTRRLRRLSNSAVSPPVAALSKELYEARTRKYAHFPSDTGAARRQFEDKLQAWGTRWNLTDAWILDAASNLLRTWYPDQPRRRLLWHYPTAQIPEILRAKERSFRFQHWRWPIEAAWTREMFHENILAKFERELDEYCERIERLAAERGIKPHRSKRGRSGSEFEHYHWLAKYQLGLASAAELAKSSGVTVRAVQDALKRTAEEIGLHRRTVPKPPPRQPPHRKYHRRPRR